MAIAKGLTIYGNGVNLACAFKNFSQQTETEVLDLTTLCDSNRSYAQGFKNGSASADGVWDYDQTNADEIHNVLSSAFANGSQVVITAGLETFAVNGQAVMLNGVLKNFGIEIPLGQLIMANAEFDANGGLYFGKWLHGASVANGTTNGTAVDNSASSANGGLGQVHVAIDTATSVVVKIQHSTDNSTWADLITFTEVTSGFSGESIAVSGTVNRYLRAQIVSDDDALVYVAFARR